MTSNQHAQMQHVETTHKQSMNAPNAGGTAEKIKYPERHKKLLREDCKMEKIMKFLREIDIFEEI